MSQQMATVGKSEHSMKKFDFFKKRMKLTNLNGWQFGAIDEMKLRQIDISD